MFTSWKKCEDILRSYYLFIASVCRHRCSLNQGRQSATPVTYSVLESLHYSLNDANGYLPQARVLRHVSMSAWTLSSSFFILPLWLDALPPPPSPSSPLHGSISRPTLYKGDQLLHPHWCTATKMALLDCSSARRWRLIIWPLSSVVTSRIHSLIKFTLCEARLRAFIVCVFCVEHLYSLGLLVGICN